jgi:hypothetical protein
MCRKITKDQQIEGWRAIVELLPVFRPLPVGGWASALVARLHRNVPNCGSSKSTVQCKGASSGTRFAM